MSDHSKDVLFHPDPAPPRVRQRSDGVYTKVYLGRQRAPEREDEQGAVCVVDLTFGGRVVLFPHDSDFLRVVLHYAHEDAAT